MNVEDACYSLVNDYPGGAEALAVRMGKGASTLSHEVDPNYKGAKFGVLDAVKAMKFANDFKALTAMAAECGFMLVPLPDVSAVSPDIQAGVCQIGVEAGHLFGEVGSSLEDGHITANEKQRIEREAGHLMGATQSMLRSVTAMHEAGKPAHLRGVAA